MAVAIDCPRCFGTGAIAIASHHVGDGCYNDEFGDCPKCHGSGRRAATLTPTDDEIAAAVRVSGEPDEATNVILDSGHRCAECGIFEPATGDGSYDGTRTVAVHSDELIACRDCTDCLIHPECAEQGLCPHCAALDALLFDARHLAQTVGMPIEDAMRQIQTVNRRLAGIPE
jgi:ssDNA-binding Zn-finger/Zn-ribbon topoisomerase 1